MVKLLVSTLLILGVFASIGEQTEIKILFPKKVVDSKKQKEKKKLNAHSSKRGTKRTKGLVEKLVVGGESDGQKNRVNEVNLIPANFNPHNPTEEIIGKMDRNHPDFVHMMTYGTPTKFVEGFGHFFKTDNVIETASRAQLLDVLYAVERFYTLGIKEKIEKENETKDENSKHEKLIDVDLLKEINTHIKKSLDTEEHAIFKDFKSLNELYHLKWEVYVTWSMYLTEDVVRRLRGPLVTKVILIRKLLDL